MVGSHFVETTAFTVAAADKVKPNAEEVNFSRFDQVDFLKPDAVGEYVRATDEPVIINFAARTDVDGIERERPAGSSAQGGLAWIVNALTPEVIAEAARADQKYMIQISTDFVFDGTSGPYAEDAPRAPLSNRLSWYGWTKSEGERRVADRNPRSAVLRISYPYRVGFPTRLDFARGLIQMWHCGQLPPLYSDQQITPTWIPDVSHAITQLVRQRRTGVFHVASPTPTTPFEFGTELIQQIGGQDPHLESGLLAPNIHAPSRAPRPLRGGLQTNRLSELGLAATEWRNGIRELVRAELRK